MKPSEVLKTMGWCQGAWARDRQGLAVSYLDIDAASFCLLGAVYQAYGQTGKKGDKVIRLLMDSLPLMPASWNDTPGRTKKEVIGLLESIGE